MVDQLTARGALELVGHEAIVLEWYKDSEGIGTWGIGVTNRSGHNVDRYKDAPSTVEHALEVYIWLLRNRYIPDVEHAFAGHALTEAQFAAALSFHYNTGRILTTDWVTMVKAGQLHAAEDFLKSHYLNGGALTARRAAEANLFFRGAWSYGGTATFYSVLKPSYQPDFRHPQHVDITAAMAQAIAA
jgi:lysozyme